MALSRGVYRLAAVVIFVACFFNQSLASADMGGHLTLRKDESSLGGHLENRSEEHMSLFICKKCWFSGKFLLVLLNRRIFRS